MKSGTFKLHYEHHEIQEPISNGIKMVDKSLMPAFVQNRFELENFTDHNFIYNKEGRRRLDLEPGRSQDEMPKLSKKANVSYRNQSQVTIDHAYQSNGENQKSH